MRAGRCYIGQALGFAGGSNAASLFGKGVSHQWQWDRRSSRYGASDMFGRGFWFARPGGKGCQSARRSCCRDLGYGMSGYRWLELVNSGLGSVFDGHADRGSWLDWGAYELRGFRWRMLSAVRGLGVCKMGEGDQIPLCILQGWTDFSFSGAPFSVLLSWLGWSFCIWSLLISFPSTDSCPNFFWAEGCRALIV